MPCYINIEDRYNCRSLKARQQFNVFAATATALGASAAVAGAIGAGTTAAIGAGATLAASSMQSKAAGKAAAAQGKASKQALRAEKAALEDRKKAVKRYRAEQQALTGEMAGIQAPVMDIGADIREAERITGYNLAQLEQIYPGAANQRQLASLAINDMIQGKLPQAVIGETMREAAQRGGAGFNIATAGKGAIAQAPQYDYARAIGATSLGLMQEGLNQSARWQQAAGAFIQGVPQISSLRYQYGMGGAEVGLKKIGLKSDMLANLYNAQLGLATGQQEMGQRQYERQLELEKTGLARGQAGAEGFTGAAGGLTSGLTSALDAYNKYQTAKTSGIPQFSSLAAAQQAAPYTGAFSQIQGMGYVPRATAV